MSNINANTALSWDDVRFIVGSGNGVMNVGTELDALLKGVAKFQASTSHTEAGDLLNVC